MGNSVATSDFSEHLVQRRLMQPRFHHGRIENHGRVTAEIAARKTESWVDGAVLDSGQETCALTLEVIVKTLFGVDQGATARRLGAAFALANDCPYLGLT